MDVKKAAKGTSIVFILTFIGLGLNYIYGIFLARWFGADEFGVFSIGLSIFGILSILSVSGLDNATLKFIPRTPASEYKDLFGDITRIGFLFSFFLGVGLFLLRHIIAYDFYKTPALEELLTYFALAIPAYSLSTIFLAFLQASHDITRRMSIKYAIEPIVKTVLTFSFTFIGIEMLGASASLALALWLSALLAVRPLLRKARTNHPSNGLKSKSKSKSRTGEILSYSMPIMVGIAFSVTASKSDFIILGYSVSNTQVGFYAAAFQTAAIMSIILQSVESVLAPYISEAVNSNSAEKIREVYTLSLRWVYILGLPLFLFFILFPSELLALFGEQFKTASLCFCLLATGQFINIATGSANYLLLMNGKTKWVMLNSIVNGAIQVALNFFLIPKYGIVGAGVAMIIATSFINLIRLCEVYYLLRLHPYSLSLIMPTLIAGLTFLSMQFLKENLLLNIPITISPFTFLIYFVLLFIFGLTASEKTILRSVVAKFNKH